MDWHRRRFRENGTRLPGSGQSRPALALRSPCAELASNHVRDHKRYAIFHNEFFLTNPSHLTREIPDGCRFTLWESLKDQGRSNKGSPLEDAGLQRTATIRESLMEEPR
jgi:hypothetical protein